MTTNTSSSNMFTEHNDDTKVLHPKLEKPKLVRLTNAEPIPPKNEPNPTNNSSSTTKDFLKY